MQRVRDSMTRAQGWWVDLRPVQRLALLGLFLCFVATLVVARILTLPRYGTLFTELMPEDFSKVVSWLDTNNTKFRVSGKDTVLVLEGMAPVVRARMAQAGIPASGHIVGKEDLDKTSFSETRAQFEKRVQRMVEGELTRTILGFENVKSARVTIAYPEKEPLFAEDKQPLTASVLLTSTNPNVRLQPATVDAIASVVAHSVAGLEPQRVSVVDSRGRLYRINDPGAGVDASEVLERENERRELESELNKVLSTVLGTVVGAPNVRVATSVELDWGSQKNKRKELLTDPSTNRGFEISKKTKAEEYQGPGVATGGVPGVQPNVPAPPTGAPPTYPVVNSGPIKYSNDEATTNTDYGENVTEKVSPPPNIVRKSVGIFLNEDKVTAEQATRIEQAAIAQAGISRARGDTLVVQRVPFAEEEAPPKPTEQWWWKYVVPAIALVLGVFLPVFVSRKAAPLPPPVIEELLEEEEEEEEEEEPVEEAMPEEQVPGEPIAWEHMLPEEQVDEEELLEQEERRRAQQVVDYVKELAESRPADVASALRAWLVED